MQKTIEKLEQTTEELKRTRPSNRTKGEILASKFRNIFSGVDRKEKTEQDLERLEQIKSEFLERADERNLHIRL